MFFSSTGRYINTQPNLKFQKLIIMTVMECYKAQIHHKVLKAKEKCIKLTVSTILIRVVHFLLMLQVSK